MRYIRTKNGIYDNWLLDGVMPESISPQTLGTEILKQADTIIELCDELVEYSNRPIVITQSQVMHGRMSGKSPIIYGAIWTKGKKGQPILKTVAKTNEEGELELL